MVNLTLRFYNRVKTFVVALGAKRNKVDEGEGDKGKKEGNGVAQTATPAATTSASTSAATSKADSASTNQ